MSPAQSADSLVGDRYADAFAVVLGTSRGTGQSDAVRAVRYGPHSDTVQGLIDSARGFRWRVCSPDRTADKAAWDRAVTVAKPAGRWQLTNNAHLDIMAVLRSKNVDTRICAMHAVTAAGLSDLLSDADFKHARRRRPAGLRRRARARRPPLTLADMTV